MSEVETVSEVDVVKELEVEWLGVAVCEREAHCVAVAQRVVLRVGVPDPHALAERDCVPEAQRVGEAVPDWLPRRLRLGLGEPLPPVGDRLSVELGDCDGESVADWHCEALAHWLAESEVLREGLPVAHALGEPDALPDTDSEPLCEPEADTVAEGECDWLWLLVTLPEPELVGVTCGLAAGSATARRSRRRPRPRGMAAAWGGAGQQGALGRQGAGARGPGGSQGLTGPKGWSGRKVLGLRQSE